MSNIITLHSNSDVPITKSAIVAAGEELASEVDIHLTPLEAFIRLRAMRDMIDVAMEEIKPRAIAQADRYPPGDRWMGVSVRVKTGQARYEFDHDGAWSDLKATETQAAQARKAREKLLAALQEPMADMTTGEIINPPLVTYGPTVLELTIPKE